MKASRLNLISILILITFSSCHKRLSEKEYIKWVEQDNELTKTKIIGDWKFTLRYLPADYQVLKLGVNRHSTEYKQMVEMKKKSQNYLLRISAVDSTVNALEQGVSSKEDYIDRMYYLQYKSNSDFLLQQSKIEYRSEIAHFERTFNMNKNIDISVVFDCESSNSDRTIIYDAHQFNSGLIKFFLDEKEFLNIPNLN